MITKEEKLSWILIGGFHTRRKSREESFLPGSRRAQHGRVEGEEGGSAIRITREEGWWREKVQITTGRAQLGRPGGGRSRQITGQSKRESGSPIHTQPRATNKINMIKYMKYTLVPVHSQDAGENISCLTLERKN